MLKQKKRRLTTVIWNHNNHWVIGLNWAGDGQHVRSKLSDLQADGVMTKNAFAVRLPRRFVQDWRGCVYRSETDRIQSVQNRIEDYLARDRIVC
jgi:hypothetical protein